MSSPIRKSTNLTVDTQLVAKAKELNVNISRAAEDGIARAVAAENSRLWKIENKDAIDFWTKHDEEHGLPMPEYRQF